MGRTFHGNEKHGIIRLFGIAMALGLSACNGEVDPIAGPALGTDEVTGTPAPLPADPASPDVPKGAPPVQVGESCRSADPNRLCLSLKYVTYKDSGGKAVVSEEQAASNLKTINQLWAQCNIGFEIGEYVAADPKDYGLLYNTSSSSELNSIRRAFASTSHLVVATTGTWSGSLGAGAANAWAQMPGGSPYGVVLEAPVATFGNIVAHELGHYLNLGHYGDSSNVMNAVIYTGSTKLTSTQCNTARSASTYYWKQMLR